MRIKKMTFYEAEMVCANDRRSVENNSVVRYVSPYYQARELFDYSLEAWSVLDKDDRPVAVCGVTPVSRTTVTAWCIVATDKKRVWGYLARKAREVAGRLFKDSNITRIHSLACLSQPQPLKYLSKLGMKELCRMPDYGAGGRDFALMAVTKKEWQS